MQHDEALLPRIQALKAAHPCWGNRRIWAYLRCVEPLPVHKKRMWRLMGEPHLLVPPNLRLKAQRTPSRGTPKPVRPHAWWGMDMTTGLVEGVGWIPIVTVLDWSTKVVVGHDAGLRGTAQPWLEALDMAVNRPVPQGARGQGVSRLRDHGGQPTSTTCMQACATWEIHQTFTCDHTPKGHADTERFRRTLTEAGLWLPEWTGPVAFVRALDKGINNDTTPDLHSTLGDKTPRPFERDSYSSHSPPFVAA